MADRSRAADLRREALNIADRPAALRMATAKNADLTVVGGAGHVGIPLVLAFAEGTDGQRQRSQRGQPGDVEVRRLPFIEHGAEPLLSKALLTSA